MWPPFAPLSWGFKTALVEKQHLGGVCLNWGCIPTKALLRGADIAHTLKEAERFGFAFDNLSFDHQKAGAAQPLSGRQAHPGRRVPDAKKWRHRD